MMELPCTILLTLWISVIYLNDFKCAHAEHTCTERGVRQICPVNCINGECKWSSTFGQYMCDCNRGWTGTNCSMCSKEPSTELLSTTGCSLLGSYPPASCPSWGDCYNGNCTDVEYDGGRAKAKKCVCHDGWDQNSVNCDRCCDLDCHNGTCLVDKNLEMRCNCRPGYQPPNCSIFDNTTIVPYSSPDPYWSIPIPILLMTCIVVIVLAVMINKKHPIMIKLLLRLFYKFKKFEDDDTLTYDAFISYRTSNDEDRLYVSRILYPKLHKCGYTLCIDEKDFIPGAAVVENILEGIEESRRSILVVSPSYCEGEWPDFEQQVALKESVTNRHRIIPIIFKDVSDTKKTRLMKHILQSITYLEWPGQDNSKKEMAFWDTLCLSLPKIKMAHLNDVRIESRL